MIARIVFVPTPPALVPEVSPGAPEDVVTAREASLHAVSELAELTPDWVAVAAMEQSTRSGARSGTFRGYGPDVPVALGPESGPVASDMPLPLLVAGWLRAGCGNAAVSIRAEPVPPGTGAADCAALGRDLAARLDGDPVGLLVLGDGATTHGVAAPGYADDRAPDFERGVADALGRADTAALAALDAGLCAELGVSGREAWQVAAGAADGAGWRADVRFSGAPLGVGYHVVVWDRE